MTPCERAAVALAALVVLALWVGDLLGPAPDGLDDTAAELAGLALFGLGCWLVPAARWWAGPALRRPGSGTPHRRQPTP